MPWVQCANGHVEPASGESGIHHAATESVDLLFERQALQTPRHQPIDETVKIEGLGRVLHVRFCNHGSGALQ